jgi:hypothetical protein
MWDDRLAEAQSDEDEEAFVADFKQMRRSGASNSRYAEGEP